MFIKLCAHLRDQWALFFCLSVIAITYASSSNLTAGWLWDAANGVGYSAFACLLYVCFASPSKSPAKRHQSLSYVSLVLIALHAVILLIGDPISIEFLKPSAPAYMWAGTVSAVLVLYLIVSSLTRFKSRLHRDRAGYRLWHRILAWLVITGSLYHIAVSGFYISKSWQVVAVVLVSILALWPLTDLKTQPISTAGFWGLAVILVVAFTGVRGWML